MKSTQPSIPKKRLSFRFVSKTGRIFNPTKKKVNLGISNPNRVILVTRILFAFETSSVYQDAGDKLRTGVLGRFYYKLLFHSLIKYIALIRSRMGMVNKSEICLRCKWWEF